MYSKEKMDELYSDLIDSFYRNLMERIDKLVPGKYHLLMPKHIDERADKLKIEVKVFICPDEVYQIINLHKYIDMGEFIKNEYEQ